LLQRAFHPVLDDVQQAVDRKLATVDTRLEAVGFPVLTRKTSWLSGRVAAVMINAIGCKHRIASMQAPAVSVKINIIHKALDALFSVP
jgi:hypothetical protein